jgi:hypothetical protein
MMELFPGSSGAVLPIPKSSAQAPADGLRACTDQIAVQYDIYWYTLSDPNFR